MGELKDNDIPEIVRNYIKALVEDTELRRAKGDKSVIDEMYNLLSKKSFTKDLGDLNHTIATNQMKAELNNLGIEFEDTADVFLKLCREATKGLAEWVRQPVCQANRYYR